MYKCSIFCTIQLYEHPFPQLVRMVTYYFDLSVGEHRPGLHQLHVHRTMSKMCGPTRT